VVLDDEEEEEEEEEVGSEGEEEVSCVSSARGRRGFVHFVKSIVVFIFCR